MKSKFQAAVVQIAWRGTRAARHCQLPDCLAGVAYRQAHNASCSFSLQVLPCGKALIARRIGLSSPLLTDHRLAEPLTSPGACGPVLSIFMVIA